MEAQNEFSSFFLLYSPVLLCVQSAAVTESWSKGQVSLPALQASAQGTILVVLVCIWSVHWQFICLNGSERAIALHEFSISIYGTFGTILTWYP